KTTTGARRPTRSRPMPARLTKRAHEARPTSCLHGHCEHWGHSVCNPPGSPCPASSTRHFRPPFVILAAARHPPEGRSSHRGCGGVLTARNPGRCAPTETTFLPAATCATGMYGLRHCLARLALSAKLRTEMPFFVQDCVNPVNTL